MLAGISDNYITDLSFDHTQFIDRYIQGVYKIVTFAFVSFLELCKIAFKYYFSMFSIILDPYPASSLSAQTKTLPPP